MTQYGEKPVTDHDCLLLCNRFYGDACTGKVY